MKKTFRIAIGLGRDGFVGVIVLGARVKTSAKRQLAIAVHHKKDAEKLAHQGMMIAVGRGEITSG